MIDLAQVQKRFVTRRGVVEALGEIDLRVGEGEFVCLVGPSGCGKTTLLNLVAGLERADEGEVRVDGKPVHGPGPERAVMFQEAALFPWLTVIENVEFGLTMLRVRKAARRKRALRWLEAVGLARFADANVHELSGGMRQRAALARALVTEPRILLMDEPFASLDEPARRAFHEQLETIWVQARMTVLFVTHDIAEAVRLATRVVVLGHRPASVRFSIDVPLDRPRASDDDDVMHLGRAVRAGLERDAGDVRDGRDVHTLGATPPRSEDLAPAEAW